MKQTLHQMLYRLTPNRSFYSGSRPLTAPPRRSAQHITEQEFLECFSRHGRTRLGVEAWNEMNVSENHLTKKELQRWLYSYLHSLIFLKQALSSYPELLSNLDMSSNVFVLFAMFLVFLLIFGVEFTDSIATYASTVAIFAVFGRNVFTQFFDAIYLIFVLCPFEVGDTVLIDGERFTVKKIHIMSTEMITAVSAGNTVVTKSNSSLMGKDIHNLSRTTNPYHHITFYVSQSTTTQQLNELKTRIDGFMRTKMQNDIRDTWFVLQGVDRECRMKISLFLGSHYSFSDNNAMWRQIHIINKEIREFITAMDIQYKRFSEQDVRFNIDPNNTVELRPMTPPPILPQESVLNGQSLQSIAGEGGYRIQLGRRSDVMVTPEMGNRKKRRRRRLREDPSTFVEPAASPRH